MEEELCDEPKELKDEGDTGISADIAKEAERAKNNPPEEGV